MAQTDGKHGEGCRLHTLAQGRTAQIQHCSCCSAMSVHLGPLTVRFDESALESLWNTLGEALLALHRERNEEAGAVRVTGLAPRGLA